MDEKYGTIYIVTNLINKKQYVGQTTQKLYKRKAVHKFHANKKENNPFHNSLNKYGIENFKWISFLCPEEDLDWQETFLIKKLNTLAPNGYNLETGGNTNKHHHELSKQKMSKNHWDCSGENNPWFGKHLTIKMIENLQKIHKGKHRSPNTEFKKGQIHSPSAKKVNLICLYCHNFFQEPIKVKNSQKGSKGEFYTRKRKFCSFNCYLQYRKTKKFNHPA